MVQPLFSNAADVARLLAESQVASETLIRGPPREKAFADAQQAAFDPLYKRDAASLLGIYDIPGFTPAMRSDARKYVEKMAAWRRRKCPPRSGCAGRFENEQHPCVKYLIELNKA